MSQTGMQAHAFFEAPWNVCKLQRDSRGVVVKPKFTWDVTEQSVGDTLFETLHSEHMALLQPLQGAMEERLDGAAQQCVEVLYLNGIRACMQSNSGRVHAAASGWSVSVVAEPSADFGSRGCSLGVPIVLTCMCTRTQPLLGRT